MWSAYIMTDTKELDQAFRLRYKTFAERLKWIPENEKHLDIDMFDLEATQVGVFHDQHLVATCRLIPYGKPWMLTELFSYIPVQVDPDSMELSRLSIDTSYTFADRAMAFGLLVYKCASLCSNKYIYAVTTKNRALVYQRFGVIFEDVGRHITSNEDIRVLKVDMKGTDWKAIADANLTEDYHG